MEEGRGDLEILDPQKTQCSWEIHIFVRAVFSAPPKLAPMLGKEDCSKRQFFQEDLEIAA